jgi:bacteriorhodopsin
MTVFETGDLTAASFLSAFLGLSAAAVLLLLGSGWVGKTGRIAVTLCALSLVAAAAATFEGRLALAASGKVPVLYHYAGWIISLPLQVLALWFLAGRAGRQSIGLFWRLAIVSVLMVLARYLGEAGYMHATLAFLIGLVFWLYILGELYFGRMDEAVRQSADEPLRRGYFWLRLIVTVGWAIYPLGNFITSFDGYVDGGALSVAYNVADLLNIAIFGVALLATTILSGADEKNA